MVANKISKIQKRDGRIVDFDQQKIAEAVFKAITAANQGDGEISKKVSDRVVEFLNRRFKQDEIPQVEQIQDIVEEVLILENLVETAKSYILYREQRRKIREAAGGVDESLEMIDKYIKELDWQVYENANMAYSLQGLNHYGISAITKKYWLNKVYPKEIREAVESGDFHIHNLDTLATYCCGWDLYDLLIRGFGGVPGKVESKPAKHLASALGQLVNFWYIVQGESAGAQAISSFDTLLAPFVRYDNLSYKQVRQAIQEFLFNCSISTRVGFQNPFTNLTLDIKPSPALAKQPVIIGGKPQEETYGEFQEEMNMINRAFYEGLMEGDAKGRPFSVDSNCFCPIKNSEKIKLVKIGEYIDSLMEKRKPIFVKENNCQVLDVRDTNIKCLGLKEGKIDWQKINFLVRHPINALLKISTVGGFNIKVTPSHSVLVLKDGQIQSFEASQLRPGDYLVAPKTIPGGENTISKISLVHEFIKRSGGKGIYISNIRQDGRLYQESRIRIHKRNYGKRIYKQLYGVPVFSLANIAKKLEEFDLSKAELNLAGSAIKVSNYLFITKELAELLGWYCAEGSAEKNEKYGGISLAFNLEKEKRIAHHVADLIKKTWPEVPANLREIEERNLIEVRVHSKLLRRIITEVFKIGNNTEKRVPQIIFELPPEIKKIFLNAYFKGDAWLTKDIVVSSISRELIYGVSTLLKQLGVFHTQTEYYWKGMPHWRINIWRNRKLEAKDSHSISKIPIRESGLEKIIERIFERKPYYYDSLGRRYKNTKNRIFIKFGIDASSSVSTSLERIKQVIDYVRKLKIEIPPVLKEEEKDNLLFFKIKKIEKTKASNGMVYDFSTESENFVADQFLVHNTFPIPTVNITKDFSWDDQNLDPLWEATAKYGVNYFSNFINSDMKPEDTRSMCCRLKLDNRELYKRGGGLFGSQPLTGSIGVVTINMPRIGYLSKTKKELFERLAKIMDLAKESLEIKRKALDNFMEKGLYPYSRYYLSGIKQMRGAYWSNHFSTIGLVGMNEAVLNFLGENIGSDSGRKLAVEILDFMREKLVKYQTETDNLYNLEATPAESTAYRLAQKDREKYPDIITAGEAEPYYTNSIHLPVNYTDDVFEALKLQDELQTKFTGGCIEKGNKVLTDKGLLPIEDIVKDFEKLKPIKSLSYNSEKKISEWDEILEAVKINVEKHNKIRIKGERSLDITTSDWHPFFVLQKIYPNPHCPVCELEVGNVKRFATHLRWDSECRETYKEMPKYKVIEKRADELRVGDYILQNSHNLYPKEETELNNDLMWLIGFFIGDGCISKFIDNRGGNNLERYKIRFFSEHQVALEKVARILNQYFACQVKVIQNEKRSKLLKEVSTSKKEVTDFFFKYDFLAGEKSYNISIARKIKDNLTQYNVFSLLSGLMDSDGHISKRDGDAEYYSVSPKLAEDILEICTAAGIMVSKSLKPTKRKNEVNIWRLRIPSYEVIQIKERLDNSFGFQWIKNDLSNREKRRLPVVRVKEVSKVNVEDNQFYDLMTEKNHNYLAGKNCLVFIHNTVLHLFLGERLYDIQAVKSLVKKVLENFRLPYITITPTFSICPAHGYIAGEHFECPKCIIKQPCEVYSRIVGYLRPIQQWNKGKKEEFRQRQEYQVVQPERALAAALK